MRKEERVSDTVILLLLFLAVVIPFTVVFFADGGEIKGFENPNGTSELKLNEPASIDGLTIEIISEDIEPIYDGTEIRQIEFWQLSLRQMMIGIITYPMAHIPLSTGKLLSLLYLVSGLAFITLYCTKHEKNRSPDSRREQIYRYVCENPGKSLQHIADTMQLYRSSLRYHLTILKDNGEIHQISYGEYPRYFPSNKGILDEEKILISLISEKKDHLVFQTLLNRPHVTRKELAAVLKLSEATVAWHLTRLQKHFLLTEGRKGKEVQYSLTPEAVAAYRKIQSDTDSPAA